MASLYESDVEQLAIELLQKQGYTHLPPEVQEAERGNSSEVLLRGRLKAAIDKLNPGIPAGAREQALREVANLSAQDQVEGNEAFHRMLVEEGVGVEYQRDGDTRGDKVRIVDAANPLNNDLVVCDQFSVTANDVTKRLDIVVFVNGLPLVVMELKNPADERATVDKAFDQLQTYKDAIPALFCYNAVLVASDGLDAKAGSLTAGWNRFMRWKTVDGRREDPQTTPLMNTTINGMLRPDVLLDLAVHFTVFERKATVKEKKIAAYHQYHAVREAVKSTIRASGAETALPMAETPAAYGLPDVQSQPRGDCKAGVVWHTQGSGKSLSMVFYAGLLVVNREMENPTIVVITDRNDLDNQLFDAFAAGHNLLRQKPQQAESRAHIKQLLQTGGGGVVFSTIQKFSPEDGNDNFEQLSERRNIVVIADEAHRSQYGFGARAYFVKDGVRTKYGFAKYLRDALPHATFIGFTGTPLEREDKSTPAIFGNYIDIYDIEQAIEDGATVPIYYESRLVNLHLEKEAKEQLDAMDEALSESADATAAAKAKAKWAKQTAVIGHPSRVKTVVADILNHFDKRREASEGKAMIVATSRQIAVDIYNEITALRPRWDDDDKRKGAVKIVMTSASSDPVEWQRHATSKRDRRALGDRFKDPGDPLQMVVVCDMWLTGFDAPCLDTLYIDKLMRSHNLMQAIARVNRIYKDKQGGLVVDYIGIASELKSALSAYTRSGGKGTPAFEQDKAVEKMLEKYDVVAAMFGKFDYAPYFHSQPAEKLTLILEAEEHILGLDDGKKRFIREVTLLSKAFALAVPDERAMEIRDEVGFFQAVKARLVKFEAEEGGAGDAGMETAIRQIIDKAVVVDGVIDVFDAAGIKKPDLSILSDEFLEEMRGMKRRNLALELLRRILNDEVRTRTKQNLIQSRKFYQMLEQAIKKYKNNLLTAAEVIEELIHIAKEIRASDTRGQELGLSEDETAFYDALADNKSARQVLGDDTLRELAAVLVKKIKANASIDWTIRESARAKLRLIVKKVLQQYGYPPDKQALATENVLKQAALFTKNQITTTQTA